MSADGTIAEARMSAVTSQWFTPPLIVEPARRFLGTIDLDPASCEVANRTVQAVAYYNEAADGLAHEWHGHLWLNPPSPPRPWWRKLRAEIEAGRVRRAVCVGYSIEVLQQFQDDPAWLRRWHVCVPSKRVRYLTTAGDRNATLTRRWLKACAAADHAADGDKRKLETVVTSLSSEIARLRSGDPDALVSGDAPAHASVVLGYGDGAVEWREAFGEVGVCW